jgi:hypothetical protein
MALTSSVSVSCWLRCPSILSVPSGARRLAAHVTGGSPAGMLVLDVADPTMATLRVVARWNCQLRRAGPLPPRRAAP